MDLRDSLAGAVLLLSLGACSGGSSSGSPGNGAPGAACASTTVPFRAGSERLEVYKGRRGGYRGLFLAGVNLGVGVPGTYAGELAATREQYERWLEKMGEAGINAVRLYTLHFPRFYEALAAYNTRREQSRKAPIYVFQGIWLSEEYADPGLVGLYDPALTADFEQGMRENVDAVHGNATIAPRLGKAYGSYTADISCWVMGYIAGREVFPGEIATTDGANPSITGYSGSALSLPSGTPSEAWVTARLDHLVRYERDTYGKQRPVSFSSWPTLDPLAHNTADITYDNEDSESLDLAGIVLTDAPAGVFYTYHAYPYYPDFISETAGFRSYTDATGPNSYVGYLAALKAHYEGRPLVIGEFGVPSSWGSAHAAHSGMDHGGHTEEQQGNHAARMLQNLRDTGTAGGMLFAWIDEWWKQTWITNVWDLPADRRAYWHNVLAAEQNFGLLRFDPAVSAETPLVLSGGTPSRITGAAASHDSRYLHLRLPLAGALAAGDEVVVGLDTYDDALGERVLDPQGLAYAPVTTAQRSEFALRLHHDGLRWQASYSVTPAYDLRSVSHDEHDPAVQKLQSTATTGAGWNLMVWTNNFSSFPSPPADTFYGHPENIEHVIGRLVVRQGLDAPGSRDAVVMADDELLLHIPWGLLHVTDPSRQRVFHDDPATASVTETRTTAGVALAVIHNGSLQGETGRYLWPAWDSGADMPPVSEHDKASLARYAAGIAAVAP
jgi:hypothetical protein